MAKLMSVVVNAYSRKRYAEFWSTLVQVDLVVDDARKIAARMHDTRNAAWWVASSADVTKAANRVEAALRTLSKSAKRWEADIISRSWRK